MPTSPTFDIAPGSQWGHYHLLRTEEEQDGAVVRTTILYTSNHDRVRRFAQQFS